MKKRNIGGTIIGIILVAVGALYGLSALGLIDDFSIFFEGWWTFFIIIPCLIGCLETKGNKGGYIVGIIVGALLFVKCQGWIELEFWPLMFGIVMISVGILLITSRGSVRKKIAHSGSTGGYKSASCGTGADFSEGVSEDGTYTAGEDRKHTYTYTECNNGRLDESAIFSGREIHLDDQEVNDIGLLALFGAIDLDLRGAKLQGDVTINVMAVFGGIDIYLPPNVKVVTSGCVSFLGGVSVASRCSNCVDAVATVYIIGNNVFGGTDIH